MPGETLCAAPPALVIFCLSFPSADALRYRLNAPPALLVAVPSIEDRPKFLSSKTPAGRIVANPVSET
jgi:hypothetical protein